MRGLDDDNKRLSKSTNDLSKSFSGLASNFTGKTGIGALGLGAAALGAVGQAAAGAIPLLVGLGAAGGTVALGMDGIKKAAESAKKPLDDLKKAVSGTFEKQLSPVFKDIGALLPKLTGDFQRVAVSVSGLVKELVGVVTSARGVVLLQDALQGAAKLIDGMGPGLATFLDGFLSAVAAAKGEMQGLGEAVGSIFGKIGDVLQGLANDDASTFAKAVAGLSATLRGLGDVAAPVVDVLIRMGAAVGDSVGNALSKFGDAITRAGPGLVALAAAGGELLDALAPLLPTIGDLAGAFAQTVADWIHTLIPTIQKLVGFINDHKAQLLALLPIVYNLATAYAEFKVLTSIAGWVSTAGTALGLFGGAAEGAGKRSAGSPPRSV